MSFSIGLWHAYSDELLYRTLERIKKIYGADVEYTFIASNNPRREEHEIIFSRAAAKFQHLMVIEECLVGI